MIRGNYWQDRKAEGLNVLTHGSMAVLALFLLLRRLWLPITGNPAVPGEIAFYSCLLILFTISSLYHGLPMDNPWKPRLNRLDHMAIYLAIAGTYTPIALTVIGGATGKVILILQWALVGAGVLFKCFAFNKGRLIEILSVILYVLMGWMIVFFLPFLPVRLPPLFWLLIAGGGIFYTSGLIFYAGRWRYSHVIWHLFVNGGAICHILAVLSIHNLPQRLL
ncbi:MAG: hemolysin III family protein [Bacillota bacterium]|nr:hemolysin III family protein [Bacillota bacterium]